MWRAIGFLCRSTDIAEFILRNRRDDGAVLENAGKRRGLGKIIALRFVAAGKLERFDLLPVFNALGGDLQADLFSHVDDGVDDGGTHGIGRQAGDEFPVDLDLVEGDMGERAEPRITGAEIVKREANAPFLQQFQGSGAVVALQHDRFRHFQFKPFRREAGCFKRPVHYRYDVVIAELNGG